MAGWYYMRGTEQRGPVELEKLVAAVRAGKLPREALVWTEGFDSWKTVAEVPQIAAPAAAPKKVIKKPVAVAASADDPVDLDSLAIEPAEAAFVRSEPARPREVSYYTPSSMPARAAATLAKCAPPTGDIGVWPLDDASMAQFAEAWKHRRRIRSASMTSRALAWITGVVSVMLLFGSLAVLTTSSRSGGGAGIAGLFTALLVSGGLTVVYAIASVHMLRNQSWGPIVLASLAGLEILLQLAGLVMTVASAGADGAALVSVVVGLAINGAILYVALRAIPAIRLFRASAAWCQELVVQSKL